MSLCLSVFPLFFLLLCFALHSSHSHLVFCLLCFLLFCICANFCILLSFPFSIFFSFLIYIFSLAVSYTPLLFFVFCIPFVTHRILPPFLFFSLSASIPSFLPTCPSFPQYSTLPLSLPPFSSRPFPSHIFLVSLRSFSTFFPKISSLPFLHFRSLPLSFSLVFVLFFPLISFSLSLPHFRSLPLSPFPYFFSPSSFSLISPSPSPHSRLLSLTSLFLSLPRVPSQQVG